MKLTTIMLMLLLASVPHVVSAQTETEATESAPAEETADAPVAAPAEASEDEEAAEEAAEDAAEEVAEAAPEAAAEEAEPAVEEAVESAEELGHRDQLEADMAAAQAEARGDDLGVAAAEERVSANDGGGGDDGTPWGAAFSWSQAFTAYTLNPNAQLTYNPTYAWTFALAPSYTFADQDLVLSMAASMSVELTDSNSTATRRELWLNDTSISATYTGVPEAGGFSITPTATLILPTSRSSLAATRIAGTGASVAIARALGPVNLNVGLAFAHWFARQNVPTTESDYGCHLIDASGNVAPVCNQIPGYSSTRDTASASVALSYAPTDSLSLSTSFAMLWTFGHPLADACFDTLTSDTPVCLGDDSPTHLRGLTSFTLGAGYTLTDYLAATLTMATTSPHLDTDGSYEMPLFNERTQISLSATLDIDALYRGTSPGGGDVAEVTNNENNMTAASDAEAARW